MKITGFTQAYASIMHYMPVLLAIVAAFWLVHFLNFSVNYRLNRLGIIPRHFIGLRGIVFAPFLHGSFSHLLMNSMMFLILGMMLLSYGLIDFIVVSVLIILISGLLTWLFARKAIHVGASALIMGYWGFSLASAYFHPSLVAVVISAVCILQLGYLFYGMLPKGEEKVSWDGHIFGFVSGILASFLLPYAILEITKLFPNLI